MWQAFRQAPEGDESRPVEVTDAPDAQDAQDAQEAQDNPGYYCKLCGQFITHAQARICVQGSHEHRFSNPAGYVFDIGCFGSAPGCLAAGEPSEFYSWFDGCSWRYALCRACLTHLGWAFSLVGAAGAASEGFFGLVLNRLVGSPAPPAPGR